MGTPTSGIPPVEVNAVIIASLGNPVLVVDTTRVSALTARIIVGVGVGVTVGIEVAVAVGAGVGAAPAVTITWTVPLLPSVVVAVIVAVISLVEVLFPVNSILAFPESSVTAALALSVPPEETVKLTCNPTSGCPFVDAKAVIVVFP
jgi:hypothetical protein